MKTSFTLAHFGSTVIKIHVSMLLIVPYAWLQFRPESPAATLYTLGLLLAVFASILLHELGHTLAARRFGIGVSSIVLWPLGGFANLDRQPDRPAAQLLISAAGPLVNLVLAALSGLWAVAGSFWQVSAGRAWFDSGPAGSLLVTLPINLAIVNLSLAIFNLIPLYPLDGGQMARAVLHRFFGRRRADLLTLLIAVPLAAGLIALGIYFNDFLLIGVSLLMLIGASTLSWRLLKLLNLGVTGLFDRGTYYRIKEDYDPAIRHYSRAINRWPRQPSRYLQRAIIYLNLQEMDLARGDIEQALDLDPQSALALTLRGELYAIEKQHLQALACFDQAIQLKPDWYAPYIDRADSSLVLDRPDAAISDLDRSLALNPRSPMAYLVRSKVRFHLGDLEGARADGDLAFKTAPPYGLVFPEYYLSKFLDHLEWALEYYGRAVRALPRSPLPYHGRADVYRASNQPVKAIADYGRAIELDPARPGPYLGRGRAFLDMGERVRAAADFKRLLDGAVPNHLKRQAKLLLELAEDPKGLLELWGQTERPFRKFHSGR